MAPEILTEESLATWLDEIRAPATVRQEFLLRATERTARLHWARRLWSERTFVTVATAAVVAIAVIAVGLHRGGKPAPQVVGSLPATATRSVAPRPSASLSPRGSLPSPTASVPGSAPPTGSVGMTATPRPTAPHTPPPTPAPTPTPLPYEQHPNQILNPSFESSLNGWTGAFGSLARLQTASAPNGQWVVRVISTSAQKFAVVDTAKDVVASSTSTQYGVSAYVACDTTPTTCGRTATLFVYEYLPNGTQVAGFQPQVAVTLTTSFQRIGTEFTPQNAGDTLEAQILVPGGAGGDSFLADAVQLGPT